LFRFVVFPATDRFTHGMVSKRLTDTRLTGRDKIMKADWIIFLEHPIFGIGPGQSYQAHAITYRASSAHTEYTRLLAEHGLFGVVAIFMLVWMAWSRWRRPERAPEKGVGLACMAWAFLYMGHSAMRLAAPAFMFGLGVALIVLEGSVEGRRLRFLRGEPRPRATDPNRMVVDRRSGSNR
jgi:O-antigen ligase